MDFVANHEITGQGYDVKHADIQSNRARLNTTGDGSGQGGASNNIQARAEFKFPFILEWDFEINFGTYRFELNSLDIRDGLIQDTTLYGKWLLTCVNHAGYGGYTNNWAVYLKKLDDTSQHIYGTSNNQWAYDVEYHAKLELEPSEQTIKLNLTITRKSDSVEMFSIVDNTFMGRSRTDTMRMRFICGTGETDTTGSEFFLDNFVVFGNPSRKAWAEITIKAGPGVTDDQTPSSVSASSQDQGAWISGSSTSDPGSGWQDITWDYVSARYIKLTVTTHGSSGARVYEAYYREGYETINVISDDMIKLDVEARDGSYPSAEITINNPGNRYSGITFIGDGYSATAEDTQSQSDY